MANTEQSEKWKQAVAEKGDRGAAERKKRKEAIRLKRVLSLGQRAYNDIAGRRSILTLAK